MTDCDSVHYDENTKSAYGCDKEMGHPGDHYNKYANLKWQDRISGYGTERKKKRVKEETQMKSKHRMGEELILAWMKNGNPLSALNKGRDDYKALRHALRRLARKGIFHKIGQLYKLTEKGVKLGKELEKG